MNGCVSDSLRYLIVLGLALLIFIVPLIFSIQTENLIIIKKSVAHTLVISLTLLWFASLLEQGRFRFLRASFNAPLLALLWCGIVSAFLSPFKYYAVEEVTNLITGLMVVLLLYNTVRHRFGFKLICWTLALSTSIAVVYGILQINQIDFIKWGQPVYVSTFGSANFFSAFLVVVLPLFLGIASARRFGFATLFLLVLYGFGLYALHRSINWSAYLGIIAGLVLWFVLQIIYGLGRRLGRLRFGAALLVFIVVMGMLYTWMGVYRGGEAAAYLNGLRTNRVRMVMGIGSLKLLAEKPILGQGIGSWQLAYGRFRPSYYHRWGSSHNSRHTHNEVLEILAEQGLLGLIIAGWFFITIAVTILKALHRQVSRYWTQILICLAAGIFGALVESLFSPSLRWVANWLAFYFIIGLACLAAKLAVQEQKEESAKEELPDNDQPVITAEIRVCEEENHSVITEMSYPIPLRLLLYPVFVVLIIAVGYYEGRMLLGDYYLKHGEAELRAAGSIVTENNAERWQQARKSFIHSVELNPWNHSALYKIGYIQLQHGEYEEARQTYEYLISIAPNYAQIHNNTGLLFQNIERPWQAAYEFTWATRLENNYKNHEHLGQFLFAPPIQDVYRAINHLSRTPGLVLEDWVEKEQLNFSQNRLLNHKARPNYVPDIPAPSKYAHGWALLGDAWQFAGDYRKARYCYRTALAWNPREWQALYGCARGAAINGDEDAELLYYMAIINGITLEEIESSDQAQRMLGLTINALRPHLEGDPDNAVLWDLFGWGWYKFSASSASNRQPSLSQAYQYCFRASELAPALPGVAEHIAAIEAASRNN